MSDTFTKHRFEWLDRIAQEPSISPGAFRLAYVISGYINRGTGEAWPGIDHLATVLKVNEKSVRRLIDELVAAGHLTKKRGGDGRPNRYRMAFSDRTEMSDQTESRPDINVHSEQSSPDNIVHSDPASGEQTGHFCPSDRTFLSLQTGQKCPPNPLNEPSEEPSEDISRSDAAPKSRKPKCGNERFEEFWQAYPRKVSKGGALKAWAKAVKTTDPATLIAGAMRYSAERTGQDPTYTKHAATWLNQGCWTDEAAPPRPPSPSAPRGGLTAKDRTAAAVAAVLAQVGGADDL
jgi:hypothetical protein